MLQFLQRELQVDVIHYCISKKVHLWQVKNYNIYTLNGILDFKLVVIVGNLKQLTYLNYFLVCILL